MLSEAERRFVDGYVETDDAEGRVRLWRESGCADGTDQSVKVRIGKLVCRSDAGFAMQAARRRLRIRGRQAERQRGEAAMDEAALDQELCRTAKEQLLDAIDHVGAAIADGETARAAALAKLVDMVPRIVSATPHTDPQMTTEEARQQMGVQAAAPATAAPVPDEDEEDEEAPPDFVTVVRVSDLPPAGIA